MNSNLLPGYYFVTAGGSGIGLSIAVEIERRGGTPVVVDLKLPSITDKNNWKLYEADASAPEAMAEIVASLASDTLSIEGVVNNAGIAGPTDLIEDIAMADWEKVLRVNLLSSISTLKNIIPVMKRQRRGTIVSISSAATRNGFPLRSPYMTSKAALEALTETMAMELGPWGIRANVVLPGIVSGPRVEAIIASQAERRGLSLDAASREFVGRTSMKTMVGPDDVASTVGFLLSPESRFISGQKLGVCGNFEGYSSEMLTQLIGKN